MASEFVNEPFGNVHVLTPHFNLIDDDRLVLYSIK
jgi:hypothetical protein